MYRKDQSIICKGASLLQNWKQSDACKAICTQQQEIYDEILKHGCFFYENIDCIRFEAISRSVKVEFSVKGNIHRGIYCPSPILDLFVGGLSRGKKVNKVNQTSAISHKYYFGEDGQIIYVESKLLDGFTEYLLREDNLVWGITIDNEGNICALSEEVYVERVLKRYTYAEIAQEDRSFDCYKMYSEEYTRDDQGLLSCMRTEYIPMCHDLRERTLCMFERQDGYIHSYTAINQIWKQINPKGTNTITCTPKIKRKA